MKDNLTTNVPEKSQNPAFLVGDVIGSALSATDFRLGNLFNPDIPVMLEDWMLISKVVLNGIPLTEFWLKRFGFEETYNSQFRLKLDHKEFTEFGYDFSKVEDKSMEGFRYYGRYIKIKYVHQLQNLFYCLSGQELSLS
ncbi:MAG: hypothetical protein H0X63_11700 [Flavobacteriales bacterium]|nr:hypothetical protein [Flavobacteriales bacterium]